MNATQTVTKSPEVIALEARLATALAALAVKNAPRALTYKVSATSGAMSMYGMRRFPITFYADEWARILAAGPEITAFLAANKASLTSKDPKPAKPAVV